MSMLRGVIAGACAVSCLGMVAAKGADSAQPGYTDTAQQRGYMLQQGFIHIIEPANGAVMPSGDPVLTYWARLTPNGDHFEVVVDGGQTIVTEKVINCPCSVRLPKLSSGQHTIKMVEANSIGELMPLSETVRITVK